MNRVWHLPRAALTAAVAAGLIAPPAITYARPARPDRAHGVDARVMGSFEMVAHAVVATNVLGEQPGQVFRRRWKIVPARCHGSVCQLLRLNRVRSARRHDRLVLHRVGRGRYVGQGVFWVALLCQGRVYTHGSEVPFQITLQVTAVVRVEGIAFARQIIASYGNPSRSDTTPCPLGPSRDGGWYWGHARSPLPSPPSAAFTTSVDPVHDSASFEDVSRPGAGGARIVSVHWSFGDPASGSANGSTARAPTHVYSAPGTYTATLTVLDADGLSSTTSMPVVAPGPPTAASARPSSPKVAHPVSY